MGIPLNSHSSQKNITQFSVFDLNKVVDYSRYQKLKIISPKLPEFLQTLIALKKKTKFSVLDLNIGGNSS